MKRAILILLLLLLLSGIGVVVWTVAGLPPVRMVWRYGLSYHPEPTGAEANYEGVTFVEIGPGCFLMGSEKNAEGGDFLGRWCARLGLPWGDQPRPSNEMPVHWVEFSRGFWIAKHEVTNARHEAFNPKHERSEYSPGDQDPVDVSWEGAKRYCAWLSEQSGLAIRLPSESEWECVCRAGSNGEFCFGDDEKLLTQYAWYTANSDHRAHKVGSRGANAWGLHDFHGNVWEWCEDIYHKSYEGAPADGTAWTEEGLPYRVCRGGGWLDPPVGCRSAFRVGNFPNNRTGILGFRPAFSQSED